MANAGFDLQAQNACLKQKVRDYERVMKSKDEVSLSPVNISLKFCKNFFGRLKAM